MKIRCVFVIDFFSLVHVQYSTWVNFYLLQHLHEINSFFSKFVSFCIQLSIENVSFLFHLVFSPTFVFVGDQESGRRRVYGYNFRLFWFASGFDLSAWDNVSKSTA